MEEFRDSWFGTLDTEAWRCFDELGILGFSNKVAVLDTFKNKNVSLAVFIFKLLLFVNYYVFQLKISSPWELTCGLYL